MRLRSWVLLSFVLGIAAAVELVAFDAGQDHALAVADAAVGVVLLTSAVAAKARRRDSLVGPLMGLTGLTWLAGTLWPGVRFLHRGPLVHLHLTYPSGRPRSRAVTATVSAVYGVSLLEPLADNDAVTLAAAAAVGAIAVAEFVSASGIARRTGVPALTAALALSGTLALGAVDRLGDWRAAQQMLWLYNVVIAGAVVLLLIDLVRGRWAESVVTGLVVDLGRQPDNATLRGELARALGDPTLEVGYWLPADRRFADERGHPIDISDLPEGRVATPITRDDETVAVLVHDVAVLDDMALVEAATAAARMAVDNARLQAETRARVEELEASRRRIVEAADEQRRRIGRELSDEVFSRLDRVADLIAEARGRLDEPERLVADIEDGLRNARIDLDELSRGIHPLTLTAGGLAAALPTLASRAGIPVTMDVSARRLPPTVEAALYFVCAEALANVAKHSRATRASIGIRLTGNLVVSVVDDDGRGGADPRHGTGLRGLADRVESLGGRLTVTSRLGSGTRIEVTIPSTCGDSAPFGEGGFSLSWSPRQP